MNDQAIHVGQDFSRSLPEQLAALNAMFRAGRVPEAGLDGRYTGELLALDIAPGLTHLAQFLSGRWMPWLGKQFDAGRERGDNIFSGDAYPLTRLFWPFYRGIEADTISTFRAFAFRTWVGPGLADPDRQVLKIDYNLPVNPRLNIRRVLDEMVQVGENDYLGKAHLKWWWGRWQQVAYFLLHPTHQ